MGPLIPQGIINGDLNFFFALIIGVAFGFILEQAGFSSSRKLAGVFYGYDFVVLKVFFTAGITAATGLFFLKYMGWIDFNFLYINPLYVWSALVGGVIMGFGFILGGFCPGTSLAAAVIGKIDAMIFIAGMFVGVFIFGVFYPVFEPLYLGNFLGNVFIYDTLGITQNTFLFLLIMMAVGAFAFTQHIENQSTKFKELLYTQQLKIGLPLVFLFILAFTALFLPAKRTSFIQEISQKEMLKQIISKERYITYDRIAYSLINNPKDLQLVDVRSLSEFKQFHLPGAIHIPADQILSVNFKPILKTNNKVIVFYGNSSTKADLAWFFATREGYKNLKVMHGGLNTFFNEIFEDKINEPTKDIALLSHRKFIEKARTYFMESELNSIEQPVSIPQIDKSGMQPIKGGC